MGSLEIQIVAFWLRMDYIPQSGFSAYKGLLLINQGLGPGKKFLFH